MESDYCDVQPIHFNNYFTDVLCIEYSTFFMLLEPSSYRKTQFITVYVNQLRTKALANLHSRVLAAIMLPHIQTIYLCNVYPLFIFQNTLPYCFTLPISNTSPLEQRHYTFSVKFFSAFQNTWMFFVLVKRQRTTAKL